MFRALLFLVLFSFVPLAIGIKAQTYSFREISLKKGLPQSQVRAINQDQDGFLWVGTLGGLARFDGNEFEVFTIEDGLLSNRITFIEFLGDFLIIGHESGISYRLKSGKFKAVASDRFPDNIRFSHAVKFREKIYIASNGSGLFELKNDQLHACQTDIRDDDLKQEFSRIRKMVVAQGTLYFATRGGLFQTKNCQNFKHYSASYDWSLSDVVSHKEGLLLASYNEGLIHAKLTSANGTFTQLDTLPLNELGISHQSNSVCWALGEGNEIFRYQISTLNSKVYGKKDFLLNAANGMVQSNSEILFLDRSNVLWIGTDGQGLQQFYGEVFVKQSATDPILSIVKDDQKALWFGTLYKGIFTNSSNKALPKIPEELSQTSVWCSLKDRNGALWFGSDEGLFILRDGKWTIWNLENQELLPDDKISALHQDAQGVIWIGTRKGLIAAKNYELQALELKNAEEIKVVRSLCTYQQDLFIATKTNLYRLDKKAKKLFEVDIAEMNPSFSALLVDSKNNLWIGSEEGLYVYVDDKLKAINYSEKSAENFVNFIAEMKDRVVIGTNNGLFEFSDCSANLSSFKLKHFDESYGLLSTETNINAAFVDGALKSKLWFGTAEGLFFFDRESLNEALENYKPGVFLADFQVNFNAIDFAENDGALELQYNENRLRFVLQVLALYQPENVVLEYRLDAESDWLLSGSSNDIVFNQLAPGTYKLEVRARLNDIYSEVLEFNFIILKPFYARWWFILLIILVLGLIAAFIVNYRIQQIRNQETQERLILNNRLNVLEQQSLNASMNRHFIFNSLNSIQYFINTQDRLSANKFLSKFAQLIRKNLDSSAAGESKVSLAEELERLKLYMSLEAMRFEGRFEYEFDIDDEISADEVMIPAMLFQPFIENAIIHGVLPNESQMGKILFEAYLEQNQMVFRITDNGVGYSKSLKEKKGNGDHFSHGTNITKSRIDVIRKISGEIISLHGPQDMLNEDGQIIGTEVIIRFNIQ